MRKCVFYIVMLASVLKMSAQTDSVEYRKHEIGFFVGFGIMRYNGWDTFCDNMEERFVLGHKHGYSAPLPAYVRMGMRYMYSLNRHIAIGGQFSYLTGNQRYDHYTKEEKMMIAPNYYKIEEKEYYNAPSIKAKSYSFLPSVKWTYSRYFYMRGGLGIQYRKYCIDASVVDVSLTDPISDNQWKLAYQLIPLGVELSVPDDDLFKYGSPVKFHAELGYGTEGWLNIGFTYRFGRK